MFRSNSALAVVSLVAASLSGQAIVRVGPNRTHKTVQQGVDAARPGDRIVIDRAMYRGDVLITKPLVVSADGIQPVWPPVRIEGELKVRGISSGASVSVSGLRFNSRDIYGSGRVRVEQCTGRVDLQDVTFVFAPSTVSRYGWSISNRAFVSVEKATCSLSRCRILGSGQGFAYAHTASDPAFEVTDGALLLSDVAGMDSRVQVRGPIVAITSYVTFYSSPYGKADPALRATRSMVVLDNTSFEGGPGVGANVPGGDAVELVDSTLLLGSGADCVGGNGSSMTAGGDGIVGAGASTAWLSGASVSGGTGSTNGQAFRNVASRAHRRVVLLPPPSPLLATSGGRLEFEARGQAGDTLLWMVQDSAEAVRMPQLFFGVLGDSTPLSAWTTPSGTSVKQSFTLAPNLSYVGLQISLQVATISNGQRPSLSAVATASIR